MLAIYPTRTVRNPIGRPPSDRIRHLRVLGMAELYGFKRDAIAVQERISRRTVFRWINLARTYPEAETNEALRCFLSG